MVRHIAKTLLEERRKNSLTLSETWSSSPTTPTTRTANALRRGHRNPSRERREREWGQDLDYSKEKILPKTLMFPLLTHYPRLQNRSTTAWTRATKSTFSATTFWHQKATVKSLAVANEHGPKRKSFSASTKRARHASPTSFTSMSGRTAVSLTADSAGRGPRGQLAGRRYPHPGSHSFPAYLSSCDALITARSRRTWGRACRG